MITPYNADPLLLYAKECLHAIPHASKMKASFAFRDRFTHSIRVLKWCERLLEEIPADQTIVRSAAILHDIGYVISATDHAQHGTAMARGFLQNHAYPPSFIDNVADLIEHHSDKTLNPARMSNELMILQDADCLDEIGALTVLWDCMAEGACEVQNYQKAYDRVKESFLRISGRGRKMKTPLADRIYHERLEILRQFVSELEYELFIK